MPEAIPADSAGLVTPQSMTFQDPLRLEYSIRLPENRLACENCGKLPDCRTVQAIRSITWS